MRLLSKCFHVWLQAPHRNDGFSAAGFQLFDRRNKLSASNAEKIIFLSENDRANKLECD